jgi:hypothetical protein
MAGIAGTAVWAAADGASGAPPRVSIGTGKAPHSLPKLPYADNALDPVISANTIGFHYGKHHQTYVTNLNNLVKDKPDLSAMTLEEVVKATPASPSQGRASSTTPPRCGTTPSTGTR